MEEKDYFIKTTHIFLYWNKKDHFDGTTNIFFCGGTKIILLEQQGYFWNKDRFSSGRESSFY